MGVGVLMVRVTDSRPGTGDSCWFEPVVAVFVRSIEKFLFDSRISPDDEQATIAASAPIARNIKRVKRRYRIN